jgi:hypothetical protein
MGNSSPCQGQQEDLDYMGETLFERNKPQASYHFTARKPLHYMFQYISRVRVRARSTQVHNMRSFLWNSVEESTAAFELSASHLLYIIMLIAS